MRTAQTARRLGWILAALSAMTLQLAMTGQAAAQGSDLATLEKRVAKVEQVAAVAAGRTIYQAECAPCHGLRGDGKGIAARRFHQQPTDFTRGVYTLQSTLSDTPAADLPLDADLERSVRQGMSSTEMPPFQGVLSGAGIRAVVQYIKTFSPRFSDLNARPPEAALAKLPATRPFPPSAESVAAGKAVYQSQSCTDCHGDNGSGNSDEKNDWGVPVRLVDFRVGWFKSGPSDFDLYRSIWTGMRSTSMHPYGGTVTEEQTWQLVDYIRSLEVKRTGVGKLLRLLLVDRPSGFDYRAN